jgi:hypothetical protein
MATQLDNALAAVALSKRERRVAERLRDRRRIRSFFIQEVDRDKIVLAGSALEGDELQ